MTEKPARSGEKPAESQLKPALKPAVVLSVACVLCLIGMFSIWGLSCGRMTPDTSQHAVDLNAEAYNNQGTDYADKGDTDSAVAEYTEAIRLMPDDASGVSSLKLEVD